LRSNLPSCLPIPVPLRLPAPGFRAQFVLTGTTVTQQPPFTVTLTDETPPPGASQPNGVVDASGIYGHRVTDVIRLKIDIKDATGQTRAYPVLVHLNVGGPGHGTLTRDPDGNRVSEGDGENDGDRSMTLARASGPAVGEDRVGPQAQRFDIG
jgi:hypothetical protein